MSRRKSNEGRVLDAVNRRIEARDGVQQSDVGDPEAERHRAPVDQVCTLGGLMYAFEHTEIESHPEHIEIMGHNSSCSIRLPPRWKVCPSTEWYQLEVPITASVGVKRADHDKSAQRLSIGCKKRRPASRRGPLAATWWRRRFNLMACHSLSASIAATRRWRLVVGSASLLRCPRETLLGGSPTWRRGAQRNTESSRLGRKTVRAQLLCSRTIIFPSPTSSWLPMHWRRRGHRDRVVRTRPMPWQSMVPRYVTCLRRPGRSYCDDGERLWKIDLSRLTDLTGR